MNQKYFKIFGICICYQSGEIVGVRQEVNDFVLDVGLRERRQQLLTHIAQSNQ